MRDAAGEAPHRLHLLRTIELVLQLGALLLTPLQRADVGVEDDRPAIGGATLADEYPAPVGELSLDRVLPRRTLLEARLQPLVERLEAGVVLMLEFRADYGGIARAGDGDALQPGIKLAEGAVADRPPRIRVEPREPPRPALDHPLPPPRLRGRGGPLAPPGPGLGDAHTAPY